MVQVQLRATINQPLHGLGLEVPQTPGVRLDLFEKGRIPNERHFEGFNVARPLVPRGQRGEQVEIINHSKRHREGPDEVLFSKSVDPILNAHSRIILAEGRGGNTDMPHSAMRRGRGQTDYVQQGSPPRADQVGMPVDVIAINVGLDFRNVEIRILQPFASFEDDR